MDDTSASHAETTASGVESAQDRYKPGDVIGDRYELIRRMGRGGMGEVWLAHNRALDSRVAIKLVNAEVASMELPQAALPERLLREAQATAQLGHPAVGPCFRLRAYPLRRPDDRHGGARRRQPGYGDG